MQPKSLWYSFMNVYFAPSRFYATVILWTGITEQGRLKFWYLSISTDWIWSSTGSVFLCTQCLHTNKDSQGIDSNSLTKHISYFSGTCRKPQCHVGALATWTHFISGCFTFQQTRYTIMILCRFDFRYYTTKYTCMRHDVINALIAQVMWRSFRHNLN